ncbi:hypothetical protein [Aquimarina sp. 2201CG14-23]|uniref:hypothetical protein n=1 Tax=Aquimarina mycalae TaxID=3040073 RepID=UPI0024780889|nr:hypothetical protein [Aquimarina sp. 2201CG14-23]MDH7445835.1 hypothetical protein [Aquimarina sp. 2201CG14-23]
MDKEICIEESPSEYYYQLSSNELFHKIISDIENIKNKEASTSTPEICNEGN